VLDNVRRTSAQKLLQMNMGVLSYVRTRGTDLGRMKGVIDSQTSTIHHLTFKSQRYSHYVCDVTWVSPLLTELAIEISHNASDSTTGFGDVFQSCKNRHSILRIRAMLNYLILVPSTFLLRSFQPDFKINGELQIMWCRWIATWHEYYSLSEMQTLQSHQPNF
jgi:hypothetical protein